MAKVGIVIPYDPELSKNRMWRKLRNGGIYKNPHTEKLCSDIAFLVEAESRRCVWQKYKVLVTIMIYKPDNRGDAINFIDTICDGIKAGIGIDDRYFSVSLDWEIDKRQPRIEITVSQKE